MLGGAIVVERILSFEFRGPFTEGLRGVYSGFAPTQLTRVHIYRIRRLTLIELFVPLQTYYQEIFSNKPALGHISLA